MRRFSAAFGLGSLVIGVSIIAVFVGFYLLPTWQMRAEFGSFFGALTAVFTGLGFIFLLLNLWVQQDHLRKLDESDALAREMGETDRKLQLASILIVHYQREMAFLSALSRSGPVGAEISEKIKTVEGRLREIEGLISNKHGDVVAMLENV